MKLVIENQTDKKIDEKRLESLLEIALRLARKFPESVFEREMTLQLVLCDNALIHDLNAKFRHKDNPTDVLSFGYLEELLEDDFPVEEEGEFLAGEVIISVERTIPQAEERGVSFKDELEFLFVHGALHVLGYDHQTPEDRKEMFDLTDEVMGRKLPAYPEDR